MSVIPPAEARSLGLKLILVGALAFLLWIPAMLIYALVWDRSTRADDVTSEIVERAGGRQTVSGPIILVPAEINTSKTDKNSDTVLRNAIVAFTPKTLNIEATTRTSKRQYSIYEASVYDADIVMKGRFDFAKPPAADWPDPGFQGAYIPDTRTITDAGFDAEWRIPYLARAIPRSFFIDSGLSVLNGHGFGAEFVAASSPYQSVNRALKYALMFLGIVFLTFFLFEATMGGRAHPAQYILLGATQVIFYLLVLAFSEHIGFGLAFFLTASATVILSGWYAATVFHSKLHGAIAFAAFSGANGLIYLLMKSEDYALLIGSVTAFAALGVTMVVTRNLDWYGGRKMDEGAAAPG